MPKPKIVLIDAKNLLYRSLYSHKGLQYKGESTAATFGFLSILKSIIFKLQPTKIYVVWDGAKHKRRMKICPLYKKRDKTNLGFDYESFRKEEALVRELLVHLGIPQCYNKDMEADDLIYLIQNKKKTKYSVYIVSSDKDFEQLLGNNVKIWNDQKNILVSHKTLHKYKPYAPYQLVDYLCFVGDTSDNIPGFPGIGEKKAIDFLSKHSIADFLADEEATYKGIDKAKLHKHYLFSLEMIDLRYFADKNLKDFKLMGNYIKPKLDLKKFKELCKKYSFISLQSSKFVKEFKTLNHKSQKLNQSNYVKTKI